MIPTDNNNAEIQTGKFYSRKYVPRVFSNMMSPDVSNKITSVSSIVGTSTSSGEVTEVQPSQSDDGNQASCKDTKARSSEVENVNTNVGKKNKPCESSNVNSDTNMFSEEVVKVRSSKFGIVGTKSVGNVTLKTRTSKSTSVRKARSSKTDNVGIKISSVKPTNVKPRKSTMVGTKSCSKVTKAKLRRSKNISWPKSDSGEVTKGRSTRRGVSTKTTCYEVTETKGAKSISAEIIEADPRKPVIVGTEVIPNEAGNAGLSKPTIARATSTTTEVTQAKPSKVTIAGSKSISIDVTEAEPGKSGIVGSKSTSTEVTNAKQSKSGIIGAKSISTEVTEADPGKVAIVGAKFISTEVTESKTSKSAVVGKSSTFSGPPDAELSKSTINAREISPNKIYSDEDTKGRSSKSTIVRADRTSSEVHKARQNETVGTELPSCEVTEANKLTTIDPKFAPKDIPKTRSRKSHTVETGPTPGKATRVEPSKTKCDEPMDRDVFRKRPSTPESNGDQLPRKKSKLDENENILTEILCMEKAARDIYQTDIIDLCDDATSKQCLTHGTNKRWSRRRQQNLIDMFGKRGTTDDGVRCGDHKERFRILEESSQSTIGSPDPSPQPKVAGSLSTGCGSSTGTVSTPSPDTQSSITKFLLSTKASGSSSSEGSPCPVRRTRKGLRANKEATPSPSNGNRKAQLYLDLGQRDFGHVTCTTCNMVYTRAQPEDEVDHLKFHQKLVNSLRFKGWKTERVVEHFDDGRIILVLPKDHITHQKKVLDVRSVVDDELGFSSETTIRMQESQTYLYITDNKVVGCVVAVAIELAYPMLPSGDSSKRADEQGAWCCSSTSVRAQCGISRVWVLKQYRRQRIASRLLDCVRHHFLYGCVVDKNSLAFSDPTPMGKLLAESYTGKGTFLVFR